MPLAEPPERTEIRELLGSQRPEGHHISKCLAAWSHHGRINTEAEFASLAGINPIPASSGNSVRHRLNRGGDRALNSALHIVAVTKMEHDETRAYVKNDKTMAKPIQKSDGA